MLYKGWDLRESERRKKRINRPSEHELPGLSSQIHFSQNEYPSIRHQLMQKIGSEKSICKSHHKYTVE